MSYAKSTIITQDIEFQIIWWDSTKIQNNASEKLYKVKCKMCQRNSRIKGLENMYEKKKYLAKCFVKGQKQKTSVDP